MTDDDAHHHLLGAPACRICALPVHPGEDHLPHAEDLVLADIGWRPTEQIVHHFCCPTCRGDR